MSEEQTDPSSDLSQDQHGWVRAYRYGMRLGDLRPFYLDAHSDSRQAEEDIQRRVVKAQLDLLLRFTGASYFDVDPDPDSWLDTFYVLAGQWNGRDAGIDEQLESIDQVLSQTGGPLWRPDLYLPLDEVRETAVGTVPAAPETAPSITASSWREPPRLIDWTPDEDPAAEYLRELRASRQRAQESGGPDLTPDEPRIKSNGRFTDLARKLSRTALQPRSADTHHDAHPPRRSVSGEGLQL
ncbi:hypothetical protein [Plantibacter sp. VKM Ac-2876]|uniref:hypothetical protein n=1 Tax=Plantibacter sp. VKM Ac-2876 TaxID=2783826 RepID=UPI00188CD640|nr:hypothetical protein [Plantibacter sp. VKM Ac-2876]MBF4563975.1 hypothetical protein [Plantibacter sp. VKM Ac-2876]